MRLAGRTALVTGGNRGIGLATARLLAAEGALVTIVGRDLEQGQAAAAEIEHAQFLTADVRRSEQCARAVADTLSARGYLDILVNGAGIILRDRTVEQTAETEWDDIFDTNVKGAFLMSKYAMPHLRARQGAIVNIASYIGLVGLAGASAYTASKAAMVNLTRSMALDHAREGVRVNCVCPGSVDTAMIHRAWHNFGDYELAQQLWANKHPLGRIAAPAEVAAAIVFLAGPEASFITGVALPVDGGLTAA